MGNQTIEHLKHLHYHIRECLDTGQDNNLFQYLQEIVEKRDVNEIKTAQILIRNITKCQPYYKEMCDIMDERFPGSACNR